MSEREPLYYGKTEHVPFTDMSETGLETMICRALTGTDCMPHCQGESTGTPTNSYGIADYLPGYSTDYDREYCIDLAHLSAFLRATQPKAAEVLDLDTNSNTRRQFLSRLQGEIAKRGVVEVLRHGINHGPHHIELFYGTPSRQNQQARELYEKNRFSLMRQVRYSRDETRRALDLVLFINGLPIFTFELKNSLTKQTAHDAILQYQRDRNPRERLFELGRCIAHFAVDDSEVYFCTHLKGEESWFLPFNKGYNDGAGNPPNPNGLKTDYLWNEILRRDSLTDIIEHYAMLVEEREPGSPKVTRRQIFTRYHQLDVVRSLLHNAAEQGAGKRYLIQHSAGSGKSNSIAWLAHQLISLEKDEQRVFDSIIVVTDRRILDRQIKDTIKQFTQVNSTVAHAERSGDLRRFIESGKKIIISTIQKFPFILDEIGTEHRNRHFAIIIDEAHSSQGGRTAAQMNMALAQSDEEPENETIEDEIIRLIESRKLLTNASYFAFTATPKNKTLELFGEPVSQPDGKIQHRPFHSYTMKQAIQEGFILDVLANYTPVNSYYRLVKKIEDDPEFDARKAQKKLRRYVESHDYAIRLKAEIMIDHFHEHVIAKGKIGGEARAMVVTSGIERAIQYFCAFQDYLAERKSPYKAIVAFSGEHEYGGRNVSEATLNSFPSNLIADTFRKDPYRFLICADKFQTGYDEPLLHTMYVDKVLSGVKAVQTLSRLNRAHPKKHDTFVLDFMNDVDTIREAFAPYYRTTILAEETDPNKLHDLKADLDRAQVYSPQEIDGFTSLYLGGADRSQLDPLLDSCVARYISELNEDQQIEFKGKAKVFLRTYNFLSTILPYTNTEWEKLSIFLTFLVPKLPAPKEEDLSRGIIEAIDMDSYRVEKQATMRILLPDEDGSVQPIPTTGGGGSAGNPELEKLSQIIKAFNEHFGGIIWNDRDHIQKIITEEIPKRIVADRAYQNACKNSDQQGARIEHDKALGRVMTTLLKDDTELFKQFSDNESFRRWLTDMIFELTYKPLASA